LTLVVNNIALLPFLYPISDLEDLHISVLCRADNPIEAGIDDHFFTDKAREGVYGLLGFVDTPKNIHISTEEADSSASGVDDGILFGVDASAELIAVTVGDVQFITEARAVFEAVFGFSRSPNISCGYDLVVPDDDGPDGAAEAGAS